MKDEPLIGPMMSLKERLLCNLFTLVVVFVVGGITFALLGGSSYLAGESNTTDRQFLEVVRTSGEFGHVPEMNDLVLASLEDKHLSLSEYRKIMDLRRLLRIKI